MDALKVYDLWLAQWASAPSSAYSFGMWQRSNTGNVAGISGNVGAVDKVQNISARKLGTFAKGMKKTP